MPKWFFWETIFEIWKQVFIFYIFITEIYLTNIWRDNWRFCIWRRKRTLLLDPPLTLYKHIYVLKISKNYHFLATLHPTSAYVIYEWSPSKNCWNKWSMFKLFQWNHVYVYWRSDHGHWPRRSGSPKKIGSLDIKYKMAPIIQVRVT